VRRLGGPDRDGAWLPNLEQQLDLGVRFARISWRTMHIEARARLILS
jgi:hypothetical protein